ncbi:hypothetical protein C9374_014398 [Naegleria lovaniensis]|uniref:Uncharacterized protein n=1 Tax=Naegleria lovaniensis TaxID=51637 RepID=A0AA88GZ05_NAELO|nr:uncharacterized protein C9374_014398 [Naegleria lovaniensis]KAG2388998.1 hypothetical protein C9374_014398 [Naegleria lovaniensis]
MLPARDLTATLSEVYKMQPVKNISCSKLEELNSKKALYIVKKYNEERIDEENDYAFISKAETVSEPSSTSQSPISNINMIQQFNQQMLLMRKELDKVKKNSDDQEKEITIMKKQNQDLKSEITIMKKQVTTLKNQNQDLQSEVTTLKKQNQDLQREVTTLKKQNQDVLQSIHEMQEDIDEMKYANTFGKVFKFLSSLILGHVCEDLKSKWENEQTQDRKVWMMAIEHYISSELITTIPVTKEQLSVVWSDYLIVRKARNRKTLSKKEAEVLLSWYEQHHLNEN